MNNNTIESIEWHKDQLSKLLSDEIGFYKVESELDSILEKVKMKKKVQVRRGGKTFWREQEVGRTDEDRGGRPTLSEMKSQDKKEILAREHKGTISNKEWSSQLKSTYSADKGVRDIAIHAAGKNFKDVVGKTKAFQELVTMVESGDKLKVAAAKDIFNSGAFKYFPDQQKAYELGKK